MFSFYAKFWTDMLHESEHYGIDVSTSLLKVYQKTEAAGCLTEQLACNYVKCYIEIGKFKEARELVERLCSEAHLLASGEMWFLRVSVELKWVTCESTSIEKEKLESILCLVKRASENVSASEAEGLWLLVSSVTS
jgi:U3 small nucleolar RNA-associated protein 6